jgi:hypothetical protein
MQKIKSWIKNKIFQLKKWAGRKIRQFVRSRFFLGLVMIVIGVSYTASYYELKSLGVSFESKKVVILNREEIGVVAPAVALASSEQQPAPANSERETDSVLSTSPAVRTIQKIAKEEGIDWKLVYAVCLKESGCNMNINCEKQVGRCDGGKSFGAYQIYNPALDPNRKKLAENFEEATRWTIRHGMRFKDKPELFFKNHNGIAKTTNQWYVDGAMEIYESLVNQS